MGVVHVPENTYNMGQDIMLEKAMLEHPRR